MEVDQELFRKLFALTETNAQQLTEIRDGLDRLEQKVDGLHELVVKGFASLATKSVKPGAAGFPESETEGRLRTG